jgi:flagella basal body P-ring formation protein FlgA
MAPPCASRGRAIPANAGAGLPGEGDGQGRRGRPAHCRWRPARRRKPSSSRAPRPGARPRSGVRCTAPVLDHFLQAQVSVVAEYVAAAVPLAQGQAIEPASWLVQGDIAAMPNGIITDMAQAIGRTPTGVAAGRHAAAARFAEKQTGGAAEPGGAPGVERAKTFRSRAKARRSAMPAKARWCRCAPRPARMVSGTARAGGMVEVVKKTFLRVSAIALKFSAYKPLHPDADPGAFCSEQRRMML